MRLINKFLVFCLTGMFVLTSCETMELDLTSNPNALTPEQASSDFFLNAVQEDFASWVHSMGDRGAELTRISYMSGRNYDQVYSPTSWDGLWASAYQGMLQDILLMEQLESTTPFAKGMGKVFRAYIYMTLVDFFGDVPVQGVGEALQANEGVLNPTATGGAEVYSYVISELDAAIADFSNSGSARPQYDFFYNGNASKWIKAANSLKKKAYLNTRNFSGYNGITDYIDEPSEDFQFTWGTNQATPDTRHPYYRGNYTATGGGEYMSNWLMGKMLNGFNGVKDPRMVYYYYRQVRYVPGFGADPDEEVLECGLPGYYNPYPAGMTFCAVEEGYWGRDHGNDNGTPPDGFLRTLRGVYPGGGAMDTYDSDPGTDGRPKKLGDGLGGAGITPIFLSSWQHFMNAEVALASNDLATVKAMTRKGIEISINKVDDMGGDPLDSAQVDAFLASFDVVWDSASTSEKLNVWAEQFFISMAGNGIDGYNSYRRNGLPSNIQPNLEPNPGSYPVSQWYPANYTTNNSNATQKSDKTGRVFWNASDNTNLY
jgi:hypothetical protein